MKLLYIENVNRVVNNFSHSAMYAAQDLGIEFHIAAAWSGYNDPKVKEEDEKKYNIKIHQIDFIRTPYDLRNIKAYFQVAALINQEQFDIIHCNTPIGGVIGRLAGKRCGVKRIIYQAHGFHFYKGAPLINWLLYYPVEKALAHFTDVLITINKEDYELAKNKMHLHKNGQIVYVPGVGIDLKPFFEPEAKQKEQRWALGLKDNEVMIITTGDLIERKNIGTAIKAIAKCEDEKYHLFICGEGPEKEKLKNMARQNNIDKQIHFLGFRTDIRELLSIADIFLFTSRQEGLSRSLMEAMASGLPCIASRIRGNEELLNGEKGGYLCEANDVTAYADKLRVLANDKCLMRNMGRENLIKIERYKIENIKKDLQDIYNTEMINRGGGKSI